jgi:hypothetical protein
MLDLVNVKMPDLVNIKMPDLVCIDLLCPKREHGSRGGRTTGLEQGSTGLVTGLAHTYICSSDFPLLFYSSTLRPSGNIVRTYVPNRMLS